MEEKNIITKGYDIEINPLFYLSIVAYKYNRKNEMVGSPVELLREEKTKRINVAVKTKKHDSIIRVRDIKVPISLSKISRIKIDEFSDFIQISAYI